ncbi:MAG: hypothetical protein KAJ12_13575 [Bacteroidetes bacterium]|nr:hypothetical protein [Bacteroidota bacterium]
MMSSIRKAVTLWCVLSVLSRVSPEAHAGAERTNIAGVGMARTSVATSRGIGAVGINPANLTISRGETVEITLVPFGVHVGSDFMTFGMYTDYFTGVDTDSGRFGRFLTEADKSAILSSFSEGTGTMGGDAVARPLGVMVRLGNSLAVAVTITERLVGFAEIPKSYLEFLFYGNPPGSTYDFSDTKAAASWTREYALSVASELPRVGFLKSLSAGLGIKLVHGYGHVEVSRFNTQLSTASNGVVNGQVDVMTRMAVLESVEDEDSGPYSVFPDPVGSGFGFDLGLSAEINDAFRAGVSVTDIGAVHWRRNIDEFASLASIRFDDPLSESQRDSIEDAIHGETREGGAFTTSLPTVMRIGFAVELHKLDLLRPLIFGDLMVAFDYHQGFTSVPGATVRPRFSAGFEYWPLPFLPLRAGVSVGGYTSTHFAVGFGVHAGVLHLDVASENLGWLFAPDSFSHGTVAVGISLRL